MNDEEKEEVEMEDVAKDETINTLAGQTSSLASQPSNEENYKQISLSLIKDLWILLVRLILKRKKKTGGGTRRKRLNPALQGLMGEAYLRFARGGGG